MPTRSLRVLLFLACAQPNSSRDIAAVNRPPNYQLSFLAIICFSALRFFVPFPRNSVAPVVLSRPAE